MKCNNCGTKCSIDDFICTNCGSILVKENSSSFNEIEGEAPVIIKKEEKYISPKKSFDFKPLLGIILLILLAGISIFLIKDKIGNNKQTEKEEKKENFQNVDTRVLKEDGIVSFNGYDFTIPKECEYQIDGEDLIIKDKLEKWITIVQVVNISYTKLLNNKIKIENSYKNIDMKVSPLKEQTYDNKPFLVTELSKSKYEMLLGITETQMNQSFVIVSTTADSKVSYEGIKVVSNILKNAKYTGKNKSTKLKSDFFDFSEI